MRGPDDRHAVLLSDRSIENRVPAHHPLRAMRRTVDPIVIAYSPRSQTLCSPMGRPSDGDPGNLTVNVRGKKRSNALHRSVTDPDPRLARKTHHGAATLAYQTRVLTEHLHGLIVETDVRAPVHHAEREAALEMLTCLPASARGRTLGADKGYDTPDFIAGVRTLGFTPNVSPNPIRYRGRQRDVDGRTTRHPRYERR